MSSSIKSKYALIDKKRISQQAQDVLSEIAEATDNFKKVSPVLRKEFNSFYAKIKDKKPEAIRGTKEYKEYGKPEAAKPAPTPEPSRKLKGAIAKAKQLRSSQGLRTDADSIERDAGRPALKPGKRKSKDGNTYYEYRENRIDRKPARYPKLKHGGGISSRTNYLPQRDIRAIVTDKGKVISGSNVIDGNYIKKRVKFEDGGVPEGQINIFDAHMSDEHRANNPMYAKGGKIEMGDLVHIPSINKSGVVVNVISYGKHYTVKMADGTKMVYDKAELKKVETGDEFAFGGRPKSALMRDRAYKSDEPHEQYYKRKTSPKNPRYKYAQGGGVGDSMMPEVSGFKLFYEKWDVPIDGKLGTIRTHPANYWVASIKEGDMIVFDSWEGMVNMIDKDKVRQLWEDGMIPTTKKPRMEFGNGGTVLSPQDTLSLRGDWVVTGFDVNRDSREDITIKGPFNETVKRLNRIIASGEFPFISKFAIEQRD